MWADLTCNHFVNTLTDTALINQIALTERIACFNFFERIWIEIDQEWIEDPELRFNWITIYLLIPTFSDSLWIIHYINALLQNCLNHVSVQMLNQWMSLAVWSMESLKSSLGITWKWCFLEGKISLEKCNKTVGDVTISVNEECMYMCYDISSLLLKFLKQLLT